MIYILTMPITQIWVIDIAQIWVMSYSVIMDIRFAAYNGHLRGLDDYCKFDHHLRALNEQPYTYHSPLIDELPRDIPGVYTIGGGRQIGKTTLLKQWILALMQSGVEPERIVFYTGELIDDHHALVDLLQNGAVEHVSSQLFYIIIDEVTYIKVWDKAIKFAVDSGLLHNCVVVLTGSDLNLMQSARMTFPGRRGRADKVDFHLHSLSFYEFLKLKNTIPNVDVLSVDHGDINHEDMKQLYQEFNNYLMHGGYLKAINDVAREGRVMSATLKTYSDWIRGDVLKRGKQEIYLKEILSAIIKRYNKQVSWHALADAISIDSHKTVSDYCELLAIMDALFVQPALLEDKLAAAPKKARKLTFTDPFIYHAIKQWILPVSEPSDRIVTDLQDSSIAADLTEAIVSNYFNRYFPTFYIKSEGEIDVAYVKNEKFWPIEVKWRNQLRPSEFKLISKYPRSRVFAKTYQYGKVEQVPIEPLPLALIRLSNLPNYK